MVTVVLLKVALMCAMARLTFFLARFFLGVDVAGAFATDDLS
jgi:hypothetical protein